MHIPLTFCMSYYVLWLVEYISKKLGVLNPHLLLFAIWNWLNFIHIAVLQFQTPGKIVFLSVFISYPLIVMLIDTCHLEISNLGKGCGAIFNGLDFLYIVGLWSW